MLVHIWVLVVISIEVCNADFFLERHEAGNWPFLIDHGGTYNPKTAWKVIDRSRQVTASEVDRKY